MYILRAKSDLRCAFVGIKLIRQGTAKMPGIENMCKVDCRFLAVSACLRECPPMCYLPRFASCISRAEISPHARAPWPRDAGAGDKFSVWRRGRKMWAKNWKTRQIRASTEKKRSRAMVACASVSALINRLDATICFVSRQVCASTYRTVVRAREVDKYWDADGIR